MTSLAPNRSLSPATVPPICSILTLLLACGQSERPVETPRPPAPAATQNNCPRATLTIDADTAWVEVADSDPGRAQGLMFRPSLAPDSGMLFVFDEVALRRFWMKNTWIALSIAYIDSAGVITDILEMSPEDTTTAYQSSAPVPYALEMNAGWFQAHGIRPGDTIQGLPR